MPSHSSPADRWSQVSVVHSDPTSGRYAVRVGSLHSAALPHLGYVCRAVAPACTVSGSLVSASQPVSLAHPYRQTRLCDSVRSASPGLHRVAIAVLLAKDAIEPAPPADMKTGFSARTSCTQ